MKRFSDSYKNISRLLGKKPITWKIGFLLNSFQNLFANVLLGFSLQKVIDGIALMEDYMMYEGVFLLFLSICYLIIGLPVFCYFLECGIAQMKMTLGNKLFNKIMKRDYESSLSTNYSQVVAVLQNDVSEAMGFFGWNFVVFLQAVLSGVGCIALMLTVNVWIALIVILCSVSLVFLNKLFTEKIYQNAKELRSLFQNRMEQINSMLDNSIILRIYSMMNTWCNSLSKLGREKAHIEFSMRKKLDMKAVLETVLSDIIVMAVVAILGSVLVSEKAISVGELFLAFELKNGVVFFFGYIGGYINDLQSAIVASEKIVSIVGTADESVSQGEYFGCIESIEFRHVSYKYPDSSKNAISDLSFITKARSICFMGENGKGKSTIIKLIAGYLKQYTGDIYVDGRSIDSLCMNKMVTIVPQETIILKNTIMNNILFGNKKEIDEVVNVAKRAGIYSEIMSMEKGFDTVLLEDGANISAGQRKRIAIARALLVDAPILILDEFSANIDDETVNQILDCLLENIGDTFLVGITHDSNVATKFSEIIYI